MVRKPNFSQVCVWQATVVGLDNIEKFEAHMTKVFGVRVQYLEEIKTLPGQKGPGGRNDLLFAIHNEDIAKFADYIYWIEDALDNSAGVIYPKRVTDYRTW